MVKKTRLHEWHVRAGAKMAPFAGYDMPISYPMGSVEEHLCTRRSVGLFDIDHMGQIEVKGAGAADFVSKMVTVRVLDMKDGDARYSLFLTEQGTVLDDLFVYKIPGSFWLVVNASNREKDLNWLNEHKPSNVEIIDKSPETYMIAVQGPKAIELLDSLSDKPVSALVRFTSGNANILGVPCLVGRTGYTGEDGVELFFPDEYAERLWTGLINEGEKLGIEVKPIGLAARDSLRFEAGMPLYGHELSEELSPLEVGFKWAMDLDKDFVGKAAVLRFADSGAKRKLVGLSVQGGVPREGYEVQDASGNKAGIVVAGMFCPTVKLFAANAIIDSAAGKTGDNLKVIIRGRPASATIIKRPFYVPAYKR